MAGEDRGRTCVQGRTYNSGRAQGTEPSYVSIHPGRGGEVEILDFNIWLNLSTYRVEHNAFVKHIDRYHLVTIAHRSITLAEHKEVGRESLAVLHSHTVFYTRLRPSTSYKGRIAMI